MLGLKTKKKRTMSNNVNVVGFESLQFMDNPAKKTSTSIMVVEDDKDNRELIFFMLKHKGYDVYAFESAIKALEFLKSNRVDIIVSDIMMPEMDGIKFCSIVRKKFKEVYFILLTAKGEQKDIVDGLQTGADDYIVKPFDFVEFLARVQVGERIIKNQKQLTFLNEKLEKIADTDGLTKLKNRRYFSQEANKEFNRAARYGHTIALMMLDIDNFKNINDTYGHLAGDYVLKKVAQIIQRRARESDIVCRYGGEEFILVLPETDPKKAFFTAEKIRKIVENAKIYLKNEEIKVTVSIGIAIKTPNSKGKLNDFINMADKALYQAKNSGKNKTVIYKWFNKDNKEKLTS